MKIALLSGKGGTGKTNISVNLFENLKNATLIDTDVEEPNSHLYFDSSIKDTIDVTKKYPIIDMEKCTLCGKCGDFCNFNAIIPTKKKVIVFKDLCHECLGCKIVCEEDAISYSNKLTGTIFNYIVNEKQFMYGDLEIGEVSGVKIIEKLRDLTKNEKILLIDSPPGTSCSAVSSVHDVDYAIVIAEPTPFGVSDLKMVVTMLRDINIPFGVVINKAFTGSKEIYDYLVCESIELIEEIKFDKEFARISGSGELISKKSVYFKEKIQNIIRKVLGDQYVN